MDLRIKKSREKPLTLINRSMMKQRTRHETDPRNFSKVIVPFEIDKKEKVTIIIAIIFFGKFEIRGQTSIARRINRFFFFIERKEMGRSHGGWREVVEVSTDWIVQFPCRKSIRVLQLQLRPVAPSRDLGRGGQPPLPRSKRFTIEKNRETHPSCLSSTIYLALLNYT